MKEQSRKDLQKIKYILGDMQNSKLSPENCMRLSGVLRIIEIIMSDEGYSKHEFTIMQQKELLSWIRDSIPTSNLNACLIMEFIEKGSSLQEAIMLVLIPPASLPVEVKNEQ